MRVHHKNLDFVTQNFFIGAFVAEVLWLYQISTRIIIR